MCFFSMHLHVPLENGSAPIWLVVGGGVERRMCIREFHAGAEKGFPDLTEHWLPSTGPHLAGTELVRPALPVPSDQSPATHRAAEGKGLFLP